MYLAEHTETHGPEKKEIGPVILLASAPCELGKISRSGATVQNDTYSLKVLSAFSASLRAYFFSFPTFRLFERLA